MKYSKIVSVEEINSLVKVHIAIKQSTSVILFYARERERIIRSHDTLCNSQFVIA